MKDEVIARAEALHEFLCRCYEALNLPSEDAAKCAAQTVDAELRGVRSHGCVRFSVFAERLLKGTIKPRPRISTVTDLPAFALLDGDRGMSAVVVRRAMEVAMDKAAEGGFGAAAIRGSSHTGHIGYFAAMALERDMIGITVSGAAPNLAPWGGAERLLGNNPVAFAIPSREGYPILLDMATSKVARGYVLLAAKARETIPEGWALDPDGEPTTDAALAAKGTMLPLGDHKGYGLALMFSFLTTALTGEKFDADRADWGEADRDFAIPMLAMAIDPSRCLGEDYKEAVGQIVRRLKASRLAPGFREILIPGEPEHRHSLQATREGIRLKGVIVEEMEKVAASLGVPSLRTE